MLGKVIVIETLKPKLVTFFLGFGHGVTVATVAIDITIDGKLLKEDPSQATGIYANAAMWLDPYFNNTCMLDPLGGSVSFYETKGKLIKV